MKIAANAFKEKLVEAQNKDAIVAPQQLELALETIYQGKPVYPTAKPYDMDTIKKQAAMICDKMGELGLTKFQYLMDKFSFAPTSKESADIMCSIKKTMETIYYQFTHSKTPAPELAAQYGDRQFICKEGTLTNLQYILEELSLESSGIDSYIVAQKKQLVSQIAADMTREGHFKEMWHFSFMEIHNVPALISSVAKEYRLQAKPSTEDRWAPTISQESARLLSNRITQQLQNKAVIDSFVDGIAMNVMMYCPRFDVNKANEFGLKVSEYLTELKLDKFLDVGSLVSLDESYMPQGYKPNAQSIIRDAVTVYLSEQGILQHPEIDLVKMRLKIEQEPPSGISQSTLDDIKHNGQLNEAFKYIINNNLKLDDTELGTPDPIKYAIENNIEIDGKPPRQYAMEFLIDQYLKTSNPTMKLQIQDRYKEIYNLDKAPPGQLLSADSAIGRLLDRPDIVDIIHHHKGGKAQAFLQNVKFTECDLPLIEKCTRVMQNIEHERPRDYDQFSTAQKIGFAFSCVLGPLAMAVYAAIGAYNKSKKSELSAMLGSVSIENAQRDIDKISNLSNIHTIVEKEVSNKVHNFNLFYEKVMDEVCKCSIGRFPFQQQKLMSDGLSAIYLELKYQDKITPNKVKEISSKITKLAEVALLEPQKLGVAVKELRNNVESYKELMKNPRPAIQKMDTQLKDVANKRLANNIAHDVTAILKEDCTRNSQVPEIISACGFLAIKGNEKGYEPNVEDAFKSFEANLKEYMITHKDLLEQVKNDKAKLNKFKENLIATFATHQIKSMQYFEKLDQNSNFDLAKTKIQGIEMSKCVAKAGRVAGLYIQGNKTQESVSYRSTKIALKMDQSARGA